MCRGAGWIGLDPTSGLFAGEGTSRSPAPLTRPVPPPIDGYTDKCETTFTYSNTVTRFHEDPRVTLPYTEEDWMHIQALGRLVDERLNAADVRLTMGGEPTLCPSTT